MFLLSIIYQGGYIVLIDRSNYFREFLLLYLVHHTIQAIVLSKSHKQIDNVVPSVVTSSRRVDN